jgi:hypothetical protein
MTFLQQEPSAHAPCTKMIAGFCGCSHIYRFPEKCLHGGRDLIHVSFQREVTRIEELDLSVRQVPTKRFRPSRNEERVVLAPDCDIRGFETLELDSSCISLLSDRTSLPLPGLIAGTCSGKGRYSVRP